MIGLGIRSKHGNNIVYPPGLHPHATPNFPGSYATKDICPHPAPWQIIIYTCTCEYMFSQLVCIYFLGYICHIFYILMHNYLCAIWEYILLSVRYRFCLFRRMHLHDITFVQAYGCYNLPSNEIFILQMGLL